MDRLHIKTLALLPLSYVSSFRYSTALTALSLRIHCIFYKDLRNGSDEWAGHPKTLIIRVDSATNVSFILHLKHYPISAMTRTRTRLCVLERDRARDFSQQRLQQADPAAPGVFCNDTHDSLNVRIDWLHMGRYCNTHM